MSKQKFDIKYIESFQKGDQEAFEIIYNFYKKHIFFMALQYFSNEETAKDIVQATFLQIYEKIHTLSSPKAFYVWMNRIAYNKCCELYRSQRKDSIFYAEDKEENELEYRDPKDSDSLTKIQRKMAMEIVVDTLNRAKPEVRLVGYLRFIEDLSTNEIIEITGLPKGTVGSHISRLKPVLKKELVKKGYTSAMCAGFISLTSLKEGYQEILKPYEKSELPSLSISTSKAVTKGFLVSFLSVHKVAILIIGLAVAIPIVGTTLPRNENNVITQQKNEPAEIVTVHYKKELVNQPLVIQVETSNTNYDEIVLNGSKDLVAEWNGDYTIKILQHNKVVDEKTIKITNIDRDVPIVVHENINGNKIELVLDDESGIEFEKIQLIENNDKSDAFIVDEKNKKVIVTSEKDKYFTLKVPDKAGNILKVKIYEYEIIKN